MEIKVPTLAESISLARILKWHAQPGEEVPRGSNLVDIETDKVTLEVPAPEDGTLQEILAPEGTDVTTDQVIATFGDGMEDAETLVAEPAQQPEEPPAEEPPAAAQEASTQATGAATGPAVRALLQKYGIDPNDIAGSGAQGRILPEDIRAWIGAKKGNQEQQAAPAPQPAAAPEPPAPEPQPAPTPEPQPAPVPPAPQASDGERAERREPLSPLRQSIAKRLLSAQHDNALLSTFNEVDMSAVMALRKKHGESFRENHGVKLGYMSFFVRATIAALRRFPAVGASIDGNNIVYHDYHDISIAVGSPRGLVVPVIRNADKCSMADLERTISDFGARAAAATLTMDEMLGGTFTITNGGIFGSLLSTPIVNPPQSAILGMHKIQQRPVVDDAGAIVAKPMMYIALTYDHRIIDGREAVQFLVTIKEHIEEPLCLLLDA